MEMGYTGAWERPTDPSTGLIQMGARTYDPSLGDFLSEDSVFGHLGLGESANRYLYVRNNPLGTYDLDGRDVCVPTPFGGACAEEAVEDVGNAASDIWDSTAPARHWIGNQAQDFWKEYGSPATEWIGHAATNVWREISGRAECLAKAIQHPEEEQECLHTPENNGPYEPTEFETGPPDIPGPPSGPQPVPGAP